MTGTGVLEHVEAGLQPPQERGKARGIIVNYRSGAVHDAVLAKNTEKLNLPALGAQSAARLNALGVPQGVRQPLNAASVLLDLPATAELLTALRADPNVVSAVPNRVMRALSMPLAQPVIPTDQYAPLQWAYKLLGYGAVWRDMESGGYTRAVTVAVVDSGVRFDHPDLQGKLYGPGEGALDIVDGDNDPTDPGNSEYGGAKTTHGTHVTGIVVANWGTNAASSCAGCSPTGVVGASYLAPVKVLPVRVIDAGGNTDVATVTTGVLYAAGLPVTLAGQTQTNPHPAQVINLSLGGGDISPDEAAPMCDAIAQARSRGVLTFVAAGNAGSAAPFYPAACPEAVAVGSVTLTGGAAPTRAWYSNYYDQVQLVAPGGDGLNSSVFNGGTLNGKPFPDNIISTGWNYEKGEPAYDVMAGTSQATPQVSALAALLLSKGLTTTPETTLARLTATATDLGAAGRDPNFGYGMINPAAALNAPPVSDTLGLRLQDTDGNTFQPVLDALGYFKAYLGDGSYRVTGGRDRNGNGIPGESGEPQTTRSVTLGPDTPGVDVGMLTP